MLSGVLQTTTLTLQSLFFFFVPCFLCVVAFFSKDFGGSADRKFPVSFGGSFLSSKKMQGLEGQGRSSSLEVLRTEMISLQVWLIGTETLASKSSDVCQGQAPREPHWAKLSKIRMDFGTGAAWFWRGIFWGEGKKEKRSARNPRQFPEEESAPFILKIRARIRATNQKSTASSHPASLCAYSF